MNRKKTEEHDLEYVILNDDESELWEIDYDSGHAANVLNLISLHIKSNLCSITN